MALDTTVAGATSDSLVTTVEASTYFSEHYDTSKGTAWAAMSTSQKEMLLRQATETINSLNFWQSATPSPAGGALNLKNWPVTAYNDTQRLQFPRNIDISGADDTPFIPTDVKWAVCEQAIFMKTSMNTDVINARSVGLRAESVSAGDVSISQTFVDGTPSGSADMFVGPVTKLLISKYIVKAGRFRRQ